ncbi:hypothetical protein RFI_04546, partial [Reticulomyxa filosa]
CAGRQNLLILIETTTSESFGFHVSSLYEAPQEERFVDTQIVVFMLSYPNKEISRRVFEPPQIQFSYLHNQPERSLSLQQMKSQPRLLKTASDSIILTTEGGEEDGSSANVTYTFKKNVGQEQLKEKSPPIPFTSQLSIPTSVQLVPPPLSSSSSTTSSTTTTCSSPNASTASTGGPHLTFSKKDHSRVPSSSLMNKRSAALQEHVITSLALGRSKTLPEEDFSRLQMPPVSEENDNAIAPSQQMDEQELLAKKKKVKWASTALALSKTDSAAHLKKKNYEEFTDEEFALFDVDETKSKWKKFSWRIISPTQSLQQRSRSIGNSITSHRTLPETPSFNPLTTNSSLRHRSFVNRNSETEQLKSPRQYSFDNFQSEEKVISDLKKEHETNAIFIDNNLNHGTTSSCVSLKSPRLVQDVNGDFLIRNVEVWCIE